MNYDVLFDEIVDLLCLTDYCFFVNTEPSNAPDEIMHKAARQLYYTNPIFKSKVDIQAAKILSLINDNS